MRKIFTAIFFILLSGICLYPQDKNSKSDKWEESFFKANQFYKGGDFEKALNSYLEILGSGHASGDLYFNMGNACYRLNMIGHAILYYERARAYIPRDADMDYNLRYVRKLTKDAVDNPPDVLSSAFFWTGSMTLVETFRLFAVINFFLWGMLVLRLYLKKEWTYFLSIILFVVWLVTGASFAWKYYLYSNDNRAVVLPEEIDVLSGPYPGDTLLFQLHSGTIVEQERSEDEWKLISLPDNKRGWVKGEAVGRIKADTPKDQISTR